MGTLIGDDEENDKGVERLSPFALRTILSHFVGGKDVSTRNFQSGFLDFEKEDHSLVTMVRAKVIVTGSGHRVETFYPFKNERAREDRKIRWPWCHRMEKIR